MVNQEKHHAPPPARRRTSLRPRRRPTRPRNPPPRRPLPAPHLGHHDAPAKDHGAKPASRRTRRHQRPLQRDVTRPRNGRRRPEARSPTPLPHRPPQPPERNGHPDDRAL